MSDIAGGASAKPFESYYNALKKHGIPAELHIYPNGWHGWVMHPEYEQYDKWQRSLLEWVNMQ